MKLAIVAIALAAAQATDHPSSQCNSFQNCHDCLNPDPSLGIDCGWCTPEAAEWADTSTAFQCMDHTSRGWNCFHLYMHDGCVAGYVCNQTLGQCVLGEEGEGDTKANCELGCFTPTPQPTKYTCNATSLVCEEAQQGSTDEDACNSECGEGTPSNLIGLYRGLDINVGFELGEWEYNFTATGVTYGPYGTPEQYSATITQLGGKLLKLDYTDGTVKYAMYTEPGWPTGPETRAASFAIQADDGHAIPTSMADVMGDADFRVFVLHGCNSWKDMCDFTPAFVAKARKQLLGAGIKRSLRAMPKKVLTPFNGKALTEDTCIGFGDCETCLDGGATCGWCDGVVVDTDGNPVCGLDGNGCCGGSDGFSHCNVTYRKTCPVMCDYSNYTYGGICRSATSQELQNDDINKFEKCDDMTWCKKKAFGQYCDTDANQCKEAQDESDCDANPMCNSTNPICDNDACVIPPETKYFYCDTVLGCQGPYDEDECAGIDECKGQNTTSCNPNECSANYYYTCSDPATGTCTQTKGDFPDDDSYFNTTDDCEKACFTTDITGVWRGHKIDQGFVADEWDFNFAADGTFAWKSKDPSGVLRTGTYTIGAGIDAEKSQTTIITMVLSTGETFTGLSNNVDEGQFTKFMYLGLPSVDGGVVAKFDDAMALDMSEWVLIACLDSVEKCDFSSADPMP